MTGAMRPLVQGVARMFTKNLLVGTLVLGLVAALAGCTSTSSIDSAVASNNQQLEMKGSPFRYKAQDSSSMVMTLLPLPAGPTRAVPDLAKQVMDAITRTEAKSGRGALLEDVRYLQDGREVWVLQSLNSGIAYVVAFADPSNAKSSIRIKGPTIYAK